MGSGWRAVAVACLLGAIVALAVGMRQSWRAGEIEGPSALVVSPAGEVWLGVDDALWRIGPDGALRDMRPLAAIGLPGSPANLVHGPQGTIVASVRRDPTLYVIDPAALRVVRTIRPAWPADLAEHGGRAINFDFDAQGRVAIATGGGHAVALFDAQGGFVARTPPDLYKFTNGLWWSPRGLWTTDTNRFTLRLLDAATLQPIDTVELGGSPGGRYLGPARAQPAAAGAEPRVALIRFHNGMVEGQVTLVQPGVAPPLDLPGSAMRPRDLDWLGDTLLVSDGDTLSVKRWSAQGQPLPAFGDAALQQRLRGIEQQRQSLRGQHRLLLGGAAALFLLGLAAALVAQRAQRSAPGLRLDLSRLGTPQVPRWAVVRMNLRINALLLSAAVLVMALNLLPRGWLRTLLGPAVVPALVALSVVMLVLVLWSMPGLSARMRRLARDPALEPAFNMFAVNTLRRQQRALAGVLREGEQVLEVFHPTPGATSWALTGERLIAFGAWPLASRAAQRYELTQLQAVSRTPGTLVQQPVMGRLANGEAWIEMKFSDGATLSGSLSSTPLADRVAQRLQAALAAPQRTQRSPATQAAGAAARSASPLRVSGRRRWLVLASLLLPGSAHVWLRQAGAAAVLLGAFAALLFFYSGPMLWTLVEPYVEVGRRAVVVALTLHVGLALLAAADAWRVASAPDTRLPRR